MEENPNPQRPHLNSKWVPLLFDPQNGQNIDFNPTIPHMNEIERNTCETTKTRERERAQRITPAKDR